MLGVLLGGTSAAAQDPAAPPERCRVGAYLLSLHDLDVATETFRADFWVWSICPDDNRRPLQTMEFVNANNVRLRLQSNNEVDGSVWSQRKVRGTFRHIWDVTNFPFDRHELQIELQEGVADASAFLYVPDLDNTSYDPTLVIDGWRITGFELIEGLTTAATTFGDPRLDPGSTSDFSRLTLNIGIERAELGSFVQLTAVAYAAFLLTLITYVLYLERGSALGAQVGLLAGALFAVAINMSSSTATLGSEGSLTLVDKIHIVVLVFILLTTVAVVVSRLLADHGWSQHAVARLNHAALAVVALAFLAVNALLIADAARWWGRA